MNFRYLIKIVLFFCCISCSKPEETQQPVSLGGLLGFWQGIVKTAQAGQENIMDVSLSLNPDSRFEFRKLGNQGLVTGTYDDFPQLRSLALRVEDSDVQELAIAGTIQDYEYQLFDGELLLKGLDSTLRLKRPSADDSKPDNFQWICLQDNLEWQLSFSGNQFLLYLETPNGASVFMKGSFSLELNDRDDREQSIAMFVEDGQPIIPFAQLIGVMYLEEGQATNISLNPIDKDRNSLEPLVCSIREDSQP